jgi:hypothetical protein
VWLEHDFQLKSNCGSQGSHATSVWIQSVSENRNGSSFTSWMAVQRTWLTSGFTKDLKDVPRESFHQVKRETIIRGFLVPYNYKWCSVSYSPCHESRNAEIFWVSPTRNRVISALAISRSLADTVSHTGSCVRAFRHCATVGPRFFDFLLLTAGVRTNTELYHLWIS